MARYQLFLTTTLLTTGIAFGATGDWPTYGHDKGGMRFSTLADITAANVTNLEVAWTYHMRPDVPAAATPMAARRAARFLAGQATPLVVDGRMYVSTPYSQVVALDPVTGEKLWAYTVPESGRPSLRGVEYWPGDGSAAARIVFGTRDGRLIALDAGTGVPAAGFGDNGVVDMTYPGTAQDRGPPFGMTSPPVVWRDLVITGSATQEYPPLGNPGDVRAWDIRTGELRWTFHSVPRPGEPGYDTWESGSADRRSGVNVWGFITVDDERGIAYLPFGAPAYDRYGGDRKGDNLYGTSLVAVDAATGAYRWHFQVVHHDIWDNDLQAPPLLFDMEVDGSAVPAVAVTSKNSLVFVLDRITGKPLHPIEERAVPTSDVPGEVTSPTQPFPVATPPLARTGFDLQRDLATLTVEHTQWCRDWIMQNEMRAGGLYVPFGFNRTTIAFPGFQGGNNWGGAALDPGLGYLFINTSDLGQVISLVAATGDGPLPVTLGPVNARFQQPDTRLPCQQPPWGQLSAVDTATGKVAWQTTLGVSDALPEDIRGTGRPNVGGPIATAGGLVFIGATDDSRFRAFDSRTGAELWTVDLPASAHATPITYRGADGRQYVTVIATGGSFINSPVTSDAIITFALP